MKHDLATLFFLRGARTEKNTEATIYVRITLNGDRAELSLGRKIDPQKWNSKVQRVVGRSEAARILNEYIDNWDNTMKKAFNNLIYQEEEVSATILRDTVTGKLDKDYTLIKVFAKNNEVMKREAKCKSDTLKRYKISVKRLTHYLKKIHKVSDIKLSKLNYGFIEEYEIFLRSEYEICHNTIMKYLKHLKKVIHFAMRREYMDRDPFYTYKTAYNDTHREFLNEEELQRIETHKFRIQRLDLVKDVFLFVCYTGLSYSDLKSYQRDKLSKWIDGKNWLRFGRNKTDVLSRIPLLPKAQAILDKYKDHPECKKENKLLPIRSNQKLNTYLSEITELCLINKKVTMHVGRHTFATIALTNGVPIETVSKMLGHKSIKTTQIYCQVVDVKISNDMKQFERVTTAQNSQHVEDKKII